MDEFDKQKQLRMAHGITFYFYTFYIILHHSDYWPNLNSILTKSESIVVIVLNVTTCNVSILIIIGIWVPVSCPFQYNMIFLTFSVCLLPLSLWLILKLENQLAKICIHTGVFLFCELAFWSWIALTLKNLPNLENTAFTWLFWIYFFHNIFYAIIGDALHLCWIYTNMRNEVSKIKMIKINTFKMHTKFILGG